MCGDAGDQYFHLQQKYLPVSAARPVQFHSSNCEQQRHDPAQGCQGTSEYVGAISTATSSVAEYKSEEEKIVRDSK